jgi:hypothetical protein
VQPSLSSVCPHPHHHCAITSPPSGVSSAALAGIILALCSFSLVPGARARLEVGTCLVARSHRAQQRWAHQCRAHRWWFLEKKHLLHYHQQVLPASRPVLSHPPASTGSSTFKCHQGRRHPSESTSSPVAWRGVPRRFVVQGLPAIGQACSPGSALLTLQVRVVRVHVCQGLISIALLSCWHARAGARFPVLMTASAGGQRPTGVRFRFRAVLPYKVADPAASATAVSIVCFAREDDCAFRVTINPIEG